MSEQQHRSIPEVRPGRIQQAIQDRSINWELLLEISLLASLEGENQAQARAIGERHLLEAREIFKESCHGDVELFAPIGGIWIDGDGHIVLSFHKNNIRFDWSEAWALAFPIEQLAEEAREWWPSDDQEVDSGAWLARISRFFRKMIGSAGAAAARQPHSARAFGLATWVLGAIQQENLRHVRGGTDSLPPPEPAFKADLANCRREVASSQRRFKEAIHRSAQSRYWQGAVAGVCLLALISIVIGLIFWWRGADAAFGVALPAGGLGAMVSLLQRMSSGKLLLDVDASRDLLEVFGMVRPLIGAVFGLAVMVLLLGGLVPAVTIPENQELAFFAGVGFLAGFNERWAQDMLKSSAGQVGLDADPPTPLETGKYADPA